ncbi:MAG: hypothetical protein HGA19_14715 [Oscillochloris sp.]|nr:hypothetical protein [Oscillochloris sp.]
MLRLATAVLALCGFVGNLGGVLLNFNTYLNDPHAGDRVYSISGSPLLVHWRILAERWGHYLAPPPHCALGDGWYDTESPEGAILPRRSGAVGEFSCVAGAESRVSFTLDDRRPPEAPSSELQIFLNGHNLGAIPSGQLRTYAFMLPAMAHIEVRAITWNPLAVGFSPRNDALGPQIDTFQGITTGGATIAVIDTVIAPLPVQPKPRWAWYYDPPNAHLVDFWLWYLPRSELAGVRAWLLGGLLLILSGSCVGLGVRILRKASSDGQNDTSTP